MLANGVNLSSVEIAVRTDPGRDPDKQVNEDASAFKETAQGVLAVVCDGMGGHAGGKEASELAIRTIVEVVDAAPPATPPGVALKHAIEEANARVWSMPTAEAGFRPGSTVVAALVHARGCEIAHVGDSRIYSVHAGAIGQITRDHSIVQEMVDRNLIRAEDAAKHPDANKILRALGIAKEVEVDLRAEPLAYVSGDLLVLCSDGLSDLVEPGEILQVAGTHPPAQAAAQLIDMANARGGHDNITAMIVRMKTNAAVHSQSPVKKTVPLTAIAPVPTDRSSGPTGTVVGPAHTMMAAPAQQPPPMSGPAPAFVAQQGPDSRVSVAPKPRTGVIAIGITLAVLALAIVGAVAYVESQPKKHRNVPLVEDRHDAGLGMVDDAGEAPALVPAPPLASPSATAQRWPRDGGAVDPCAALQRARARDAGADLLQKLNEKCAATGVQL